MKASSNAGLKNYSLNVAQSSSNLRTYSENINQNEFKTEKIWNVIDEPFPVLEQPVTLTYTVADETNRDTTVTKDISIQQKTIRSKRALVENDMRIERYSLVLFEIDKADLTSLHRKVLDDIKKSIQPNSKLHISGYADRTGDEQYNINLAQRRCERINNYINPGNKINVELDAVGNRSLIYNNDLPEARAFSRTVKIEIRTPVK
jgi:outer membrane protein OmpA-like peptidoglycan-associated protein